MLKGRYLPKVALRSIEDISRRSRRCLKLSRKRSSAATNLVFLYVGYLSSLCTLRGYIADSLPLNSTFEIHLGCNQFEPVFAPLASLRIATRAVL